MTEIRQAIDRVIGTTIDWTLHPDKHRYDKHLEAEREALALIEKHLSQGSSAGVLQGTDTPEYQNRGDQ